MDELPPSPSLVEGADSHSHRLPFLDLFHLNINLFSCPKGALEKRPVGHIHTKYKWLIKLKCTMGKFTF